MTGSCIVKLSRDAPQVLSIKWDKMTWGESDEKGEWSVIQRLGGSLSRAGEVGVGQMKNTSPYQADGKWPVHNLPLPQTQS